MKINFPTQFDSNDLQFVEVQKTSDNRFVLIHLSANDPQTAAIAALAMESGMFAVYSRSNNHYDFTNKVYQEVAGTSLVGSKVANLRKALLPVNDENDELESASFGDLSDERLLSLKIAVGKVLSGEDSVAVKKEPDSKSKPKNQPILPTAKLSTLKNSQNTQSPIQNLPKSKETENYEVIDAKKQEVANQEKWNQEYQEKLEEQKTKSVKQKIEAYEKRKLDKN